MYALNTVSLPLQMTLRFNGYIENGYECDFFISLLYAIFMTICGNFGFGINLRSGNILFLVNWRREKNAWNILLHKSSAIPLLLTCQQRCYLMLCYACELIRFYWKFMQWVQKHAYFPGKGNSKLRNIKLHGKKLWNIGIFFHRK